MRKKILNILIIVMSFTICIIPINIGAFSSKNDSTDEIIGNDLQSDNVISSTTSLEHFNWNKPRSDRTYWLHIPPSYDGSTDVPLVLILHGAGAFSFSSDVLYWFKVGLNFFKSSWVEGYTEFSKKADEEGFIAIYPNAKFDFFSFKWQYNYGFVPGKNPFLVDDIGYFRALINYMIKNYRINSSRIYVTGISDGGVMTYSVGAYLSDIVAAIAPVAGTIGGNYSLIWKNKYYQIPIPKNPVSVVAFHGTADSLAPYDGGGPYNDASVNQSIAFWVQHNGCNPIPIISETGKINQTTYTNGTDGTEVMLYTTVGGEHWWPGNPLQKGPFRLIDSIREISATDIIWEFFEAHPKN
jgi:polyhydroxybutyrate depolymerase